MSCSCRTYVYQHTCQKFFCICLDPSTKDRAVRQTNAIKTHVTRNINIRMHIVVHMCLDYGSKCTRKHCLWHKLVCDSALCEKIILPCFNTILCKYFKIFYDKHIVGSVLALYSTRIFYCDMYNCNYRLFGKLSWL